MQQEGTHLRVLAALTAALIIPAIVPAQTTGYVLGGTNSLQSVTSFNFTTGKITKTFFNSYGQGTDFAVGPDDSTLYVPATGPNVTGALDIVSGETGLLLNSVPLPYPATKAIINTAGSTVYVAARADLQAAQAVVAVDTANATVSGTISISPPAILLDITLSPDSSTLFVSVACFPGSGTCDQQPTGCPVANGICAYDANTLALKWEITQPTGIMSVSHDGSALYDTPYHGYPLYMINTSTMAVSHKYLSFSAAGAVIMSPLANYGLLFSTGENSVGAAYLLNTSTNNFVAELFASVPNGATVSYQGFISSGPTGGFVAWAPNGKSVWMVMQCTLPIQPSCTIPGDSGRALLGINVLTGETIAEVALPEDAQNLAFPR